MYFLDLTLPTPEENLALDEALLRTAEMSGSDEYFRVWESVQYIVVMGKNCRIEGDVWIERCQADGISILRRFSGGGTVLLGPGCLNYSVVLRYDRTPGLESITESFAHCLDRVQSAAMDCGMHVGRAGSDLIWQDRKFGGSAQRRQRTHFLHHGTILYRFDLAVVGKYLKEPRRQPVHRAGRDHSTFLRCLPAERGSLTKSLRSVWNAADNLDSPPLDLVAELVKSRYGRPDWNYRDCLAD